MGWLHLPLRAQCTVETSKLVASWECGRAQLVYSIIFCSFVLSRRRWPFNYWIIFALKRSIAMFIEVYGKVDFTTTSWVKICSYYFWVFTTQSVCIKTSGRENVEQSKNSFTDVEGGAYLSYNRGQKAIYNSNRWAIFTNVVATSPIHSITRVNATMVMLIGIAIK